MDAQEVMLQYWGKALTSEENGTPYHLLAYHVLDVAAIAEVWWQHSRVIRQRFNHATGLDEAQTQAWILFFIALHDYGKWDIRFQLKAIDALKALFPAFALDMVDPDRNYYHGPGGYTWLLWEDSRYLGFSDDQLDSWQPWLRAVTGHVPHGCGDEPHAVADGACGVLLTYVGVTASHTPMQ